MTQIAFFDDPARRAQKANELADELEQRIADGGAHSPRARSASLLLARPWPFRT